MINWKNNFIFLAIHFVVCFLIFLVCSVKSVLLFPNNITIIACIAYVGIAYLLSGNLIQIGNRKHNIGSVLFLAIILVLSFLFCNLTGKYFWESTVWIISYLIWLAFFCALGPFLPFSVDIVMQSFKGSIEGVYAILLLFVAIVPSFLFWLGIELKALYLKRKNKLVPAGILIGAILLIVGSFVYHNLSTPSPIATDPSVLTQPGPSKTTQAEPAESEALLNILDGERNSNNQLSGESNQPFAHPVNNKLYFWEDNILKCYDSTTKELKQFEAIVADDPGDCYFKWLISGDEKKVAWTEKIEHRVVKDEKTWTDYFKITLSVADLDGQNKHTLVLEGAGREVVELANFYDSEELYYGTQFGEAGGWFVNQYLEDLYKLNTATGEKELLLGRQFDPGVGCYITALSSKAEYVLYFKGLTLVVRELASGKETRIPIPVIYDPVYFGTATFSADEKEITFPLASYIGSPDEYEIYKYVTVNLETKTVKISESKMGADSEEIDKERWEKDHNLEALGKKVTGSESEVLALILKGIDNPLNRNKQMIEYYDGTPLVAYQLLGDQLFFSEDKILKCYNLKTKELTQFESVVSADKSSLWLVSGDGQKVAWTEQISESEYAIYVADFNGMNKLMIIREGFAYNLLLENFDHSAELYFGERIADVSYHYDNLQNLYKLDLSTGESELILEKKFE
jgi:hypothetical protein